MNTASNDRMNAASVIGLAVLFAAAPAHGAKHDANGDGFSDLAVGMPEKSINGQIECGAVHVIYGSNDGLRVNGDQFWHQDQPGVNNSCATNDSFGSALAWGDFDGDGFDDLAIGVPGETVAGILIAGAVQVLYGTSDGLDSAGDQLWHQNSPGIADSPQMFDAFGSALATGDFDGDGFDDLAIGVPQESIGGISEAGAVHIIYGSNSGLQASGDQFFHQNTSGVSDVAESYDHFGQALAAGDFDNDGRDDLAIGVPYEVVDGIDSAGAVNVLYGSNSGLTTSGDQFWHQDSPGVNDLVEESDFFGSALAAGDFDADGRDDLAIGSPGEDVDDIDNAGAINVIYGSNNGLSANGDQFLNQNSPGIKDSAEVGDGFGKAMTVGDFDGDGHADLAISLADEDLGDIADASAVAILFGANGGLSASGNQFLHKDVPGINGVAKDVDDFGASVVAGDFDGDGIDDLAIGAPGEEVPLAPGQTISKVTVSLFLSHAYPSDVDILLVGPAGQNVMLMSDAGGNTPAGVNLTFDDDAPDFVPAPLSAGTYKPTNEGASDAFPAPAPTPSGSTSLSDFIGTSPVGTWSLFIFDDFAGDGGSIPFWVVNIETIGSSPMSSVITIPGSGGAATTYPSNVTFENAVQNGGSVHVLYGTHDGLSSQGDQVFHQNTPGMNDTTRRGDIFGLVL